MSAISIIERRQWTGGALLFIVGPGGAGKSSLGQLLAPLTHRRLLDLDQIFKSEVGPIDQYIQNFGNEAYRSRNSSLAKSLVRGCLDQILLVTSSGFLAEDNPPLVLADNQALLRQGYSLSLLPDDDHKLTCEIIVERKMSRGLVLDPQRERQKINSRLPVYRAAGDMLVVSKAALSTIAATVAERISTRR